MFWALLLTNARTLNKEDKGRLVAGIKQSKEGKDFIDNYSGVASALITKVEINNEVQKLKPEDVNTDIIGKVRQTILKMMPEDISQMTKEDKTRFLNTIRLETRIGKLMFNFLNTENKGAPSDKDFAFIRGLVMGGEFDNITSIKEAFNTFIQQNIRDTQDTFDNNPSFVILQNMKSKDNYEKMMNLESDIRIKVADKEDSVPSSKSDIVIVKYKDGTYEVDRATKKILRKVD